MKLLFVVFFVCWFEELYPATYSGITPVSMFRDSSCSTRKPYAVQNIEPRSVTYSANALISPNLRDETWTEVNYIQTNLFYSWSILGFSDYYWIKASTAPTSKVNENGIVLAFGTCSLEIYFLWTIAKIEIRCRPEVICVTYKKLT